MSLDAMELDLSKSFVKGMGYVALSRVRSLAGVRLLGLNELALHVDPEILEMDEKFRELSIDAQEDLREMSTKQLEDAQKAWLKKIEPEEKVKMKRKEKQENQIAKKSTHEITREMLEAETPLDEIARKRGVKAETIVSHIEDMQREGDCPDVDYLKRGLKRSEFEDIILAFEKAGTKTLSPVYNLLLKQKKKPNFLKLRLVRLFL
jgi:hypothetical protein